MRAIPCTLAQANTLVATLHRHHKPVLSHRFSIAAMHEGHIVGAVIAGRPVAPASDAYMICEVTRLVTDGTFNACSFLYQAAARTAKEMGFNSIQTFILEEEPGTSLRAAGWTFLGKTSGGSWNRAVGHTNRRTDQPQGPKMKWGRVLNPSVVPPFVNKEIDLAELGLLP